MNVRLRMYQVLLLKFRRHLCKGSIVPWIWNCLDNNYVLLLYRVRLSGRLGLSFLRISAKSAYKSSLQEQDMIKAADKFLRNTFSVQ